MPRSIRSSAIALTRLMLTKKSLSLIMNVSIPYSVCSFASSETVLSGVRAVHFCLQNNGSEQKKHLAMHPRLVS